MCGDWRVGGECVENGHRIEWRVGVGPGCVIIVLSSVDLGEFSQETEQRSVSTVNTSASKRTQTLKEEVKCGAASKWTQSEGAGILWLFKREMSTEEEQTHIYHGASLRLKQPVLKLHRMGECVF